LESDGLQFEALGSSLITERGYAGLLMDLLGQHGATAANAVIDGVRHQDMLLAVEGAYDRALSVYIDVPDTLRYERWLTREGVERTDETVRIFSQLSHADVERHVFGLRKMANLIVDGSLPADALVTRLLSWTREEFRVS
jgi:hypothetical protein